MERIIEHKSKNGMTEVEKTPVVSEGNGTDAYLEKILCLPLEQKIVILDILRKGVCGNE